MKRYIALLACMFALTACGNQSSSDNAKSNASGSDNSTSASTDTGSSNDSGDKAGAFKNKNEKRSYAMGMDIGNSLKELPIKLDLDALSQGLRDEVNGKQTRLSKKELSGVMQNVVSDMEAAQKQKLKQQSQDNLEKGKKFLSENKKKEGVKVLPDGLQYKVIKPGTGPKPDANDTVTVDYVGKLIDGTVFDSSKKHGKPVTFPVNAVIPGWTEALQLMKQGAEYKLFVPPNLAYGERGAGSEISPNQTLVFDVHLLKVDKKKGDGSGDEEDQTSAGDQSQKQSAAPAAGDDDGSADQASTQDSASTAADQSPSQDKSSGSSDQ